MFYQHRIWILTAFCLLFYSNLLAQIKINEIVASNSESCYDENQNSPDWIELYNACDQPVNLKGYRIFDKNNFEEAWILPDTVLQPKDFLLIFASGESRNESGYYVIEASGHGIAPHNATDGMCFAYIPLTGNFDISVNFNSLRNYESNTYAALMVREKLTEDSRYAGMFCQNPEKAGYLFFFRETERENPFVEYFYNRETKYPDCSVRITRTGNDITGYILDEKYIWYTKNASVNMSMQDDTVFVGIALSSANNDVLSKLTFSNLVLNGLPLNPTDLNKIEFNTSITSKNYFSKEIHANFKLDKEEETIYLWNPEGNLIDNIEYKEMANDVSYGSYPDGTSSMKYFFPTTPENKNNNAFSSIAKVPEFSNEGGWFITSQYITLFSEDIDAEIYYTIDGSVPNKSSIKYLGNPIRIDTNTVIRAGCFKEDARPSDVISNSYFINDSSSVQVISLTIDPFDLWNKEDGILVPENVFYSNEIPVNFELWNNDKQLIYEAEAGAKIHGWTSRRFPQKSFRLYAKSKYGTTIFKYPFFGKEGMEEYERIILRNGGTEWWRTFLRDGFSAVVTEQMQNLDGMAFSPSVMFLNGRFYGIQNIRERIDESYIHLKYDVPYESIDLFEDWDDLLYGSSKEYHEMYDSVMNYNMSNTDAYSFIDRNIDVANIIEYVALEMYLANIDWPFHNLKYWKSWAYDNKWRWVLNDLDYTSGNGSFPQLDMFPFATDGKEIFSRFFPKLLENEQFKYEFLNRSADLINTVFLPKNMLNILDSLANILRPEIPRQHAKYDSSAVNWEDEIYAMRDFLSRRHKYFPTHYVNYFNLTDTFIVTLDVEPKGAGKIKISTIIPDSYPWQGKYFQDIPVKIQAIADKGYDFSHWLGTQISSDTITVLLKDFENFTAVFDNGVIPDTNIVINEIMYKPDNNIDTEDWIELYNAGKTLDISGWRIKDDNDNHIFFIPDNTIFDEETYLVICRDTTKFINYHSSVTQRIGNFDFGLGEDDVVWLLDKEDILIDIVDYDFRIPWPTNSNGTGNSIELINTDYDNEIAKHWRSSIENKGTPGRLNSTLVDSQDVLPQFSNSKITIYPNPFSEQSTIVLNLVQNETLSLTIYNDFGTMIDTIVNEKAFSSGKHIIRYVNENLSSGHYFLHLKSKDNISVLSFVVIR